MSNQDASSQLDGCSSTPDVAQLRSLLDAISGGKWSEITELLTCGDSQCDVADRDAGGNTALHLACQMSDTPDGIIASLLQLGAEPLAVNDAKQTALEVAIRNKKCTGACLLVPYVPENKINAILLCGTTPLQTAQQAGDTATMAALIARGADIGSNATRMSREAHDQKDDVMLAALVLVVKQSVLDMLDVEYKRMVEARLPKSAAACLKRAHKDPAAVVDDEQQSFVHKCASEQGTYQLCVELLALGIPIGAPDKNGNTPLHIAAKSGNLDVAKALCEHGADVMARNKNNRTPRMVPKIPSDMKDFLYDMEELHKQGKLQQKAKLWDDKMAATQTQSAFGIRAL
eukprot:jgi/Ulvmu1/2646/UM014_0098.1